MVKSNIVNLDKNNRHGCPKKDSVDALSRLGANPGNLWMLSANYHREQARVLAALALSSKNPFQASLFTQAAREHLEQAQAPSDDGVRSDAAPDGWSGALIRSRKTYSKRQQAAAGLVVAARQRLAVR